ncbi:MAG: hypothetical protein REI64_00335 [Pedobacter sp.]|nr:hypothetical protein [Pedobacter sp.]MDQ8003208.1 hypothetical protein [Pedobacter sp.]
MILQTPLVPLAEANGNEFAMLKPFPVLICFFKAEANGNEL